MAQLVKNLPEMQDTWVRPLGQEDPLEKEMATHSSILAWEILWKEEPSSPRGLKSQARLSDSTTATTYNTKQVTWTLRAVQFQFQMEVHCSTGSWRTQGSLYLSPLPVSICLWLPSCARRPWQFQGCMQKSQLLTESTVMETECSQKL